MESFGVSEVQFGSYGGIGLGIGIADERQQLGQESSVALPPATDSSFTALLELSPGQAVELLHSAGGGGEYPPSADDFAGNVLNRHRIIHQIPYAHTLNCSLPFPSNASLIERAAKYSVFATGGASGDGSHDSPETYSSGRALKMKSEPADSNSNPNLASQVSDPTFMCQIKKTAKRKEREEKGKRLVKKSRITVKDNTGDGEKLQYVHVRARRGEATDSHSLAERARREKINARMKLLQELVPGCTKISGTALVLEQIINHVQNLQRQVEYLSMKLAAVSPRNDFNLDSLFAAGNGSLMGGNFQSMMIPLTWPEIQMNGDRQQGQEQCPFESVTHPDLEGEEDQCHLITPANSLLSYDSSGNSASLHPSQQKMELGNAS